MQPDFGQTMLISIVWGALFFMAGLHWFWVLGLGGVGVARHRRGLYPHPARHRAASTASSIPEGADTFQVDTAMESFLGGGWLGKGPGEGTVKRILPDSHTDFIMAVTAEEFGILFCMVLVLLFAFIVLRGLLARAQAGGSVLPLRHRRPDVAVRPAVLDQPDGQPAHDARPRA